MVTPEKIAELRELLAKATPGEWNADYDKDAPPMEDGAVYAEHPVCQGIDYGDAAIIAAMKNALPDLLDAAEELARVHKWARQPHVCGGLCTDGQNGGNCGTCTSGGRNAEHVGEPGWTDNFRPEWNRERRDIPITQAFRELREEFGHHFADIDVDKFCHDVRYGEDEEATK